MKILLSKIKRVFAKTTHRTEEIHKNYEVPM